MGPLGLADKVSTINLLRGAFPSESSPARFWLTLLFQVGDANLIYGKISYFYFHRSPLEAAAGLLTLQFDLSTPNALESHNKPSSIYTQISVRHWTRFSSPLVRWGALCNVL